MARILADRVLESTSSTGLGVIALSAAITGFRRFNAVCALSDTVPYFIEAIDTLGQPTGDYEYGLGTYSAANTLTRTTVLGSSNGGAAVNFTAGSKNVGITLQADGFQSGSNANGFWRKNPDGSIEQWGIVVSGGTGGVTATFPIPFPTSLDAVNVSIVNDAPSLATWQSPTLASVFVQAWTLAGAPLNKSVSWRAVGR